MSRIDKLEKYGKFAIPYIVFRDENNIPHFKVNNNVKTEECISKELCSVCGEKLEDDKWLIGGRLSAFHERGCYVDIPVHKECGVYSLKTCPYMAYTQYTAKGMSEKEKAYLDSIGVFTVNPTIDNNRLQYFVFVKIKSYEVRGFSRHIYPEKPYLEIEFWKDGTQISFEEASELDPELKSLINSQLTF
jgi:hypothetical protein